MVNKIKINKGITLIALVITIIVLLILAGVAISMLTGDNGILRQAANAKEETEKAQQNETEVLEEMEDVINDTVNPDEFTKIKHEVLSNPEKYLEEAKELGQVKSQDIGIGTDGKVVNLDLWIFYKDDSKKTISIGNGDDASIGNPGYLNKNIVNGKIQGTVPQYIYINDVKKIYTVTSLAGCFAGCSNMTEAPTIPSTVTNLKLTFTNQYFDENGIYQYEFDAPHITNMPKIPYGVTNMQGTFMRCKYLLAASEIPNTVVNMRETFSWCSNLVYLPPEIPSSVKYLDLAFEACKKLGTDLIINANPESYSGCFYDAATAGYGVKLKGSSTMLEQILDTKSKDSNITIEK